MAEPLSSSVFEYNKYILKVASWIWIISHTPLLTIMMWEVFMQQYSNTPEIWGCNNMIGTTDNKGLALHWLDYKAALQIQATVSDTMTYIPK